MEVNPITDHIAAISVGVLDGVVLLDLEYTEDVAADVDSNVVMTGSGEIIEVQATAEGRSFSTGTLDVMLEYAASGIAVLVDMQKTARS
jgi:ribonuclease PH